MGNLCICVIFHVIFELVFKFVDYLPFNHLMSLFHTRILLDSVYMYVCEMIALLVYDCMF